MKTLLTLLAAFWLLTSPLIAEEKKDDIDYIALAALLMRDGHYDRAEEALKSVNLEDEAVDKVRYYTLSGLVYMKKGLFVGAVENFESAITAGQTDPVIYLYIAQAHFELKAYDKTIEALDNAGELAKEKPNFFAIRAQCHWKLKEYNQALITLKDAYARFPEHSAFLKQSFFYLVELQLYQEALEYAQKYLASGSADADAYLAIGSALKQSSEYAEAIQILEEARLKYETNTKITILLAHLYIDVNQIHAAADLFDKASILDSTYIAEASELYRRAKELYRSLYLNAQITDQQEKYKQRLAILLEFGDYEKAAAMADALERVELVENEDIRYALAFTLYQIGDYETCETHLQQLTRPDLFRKATELRDNIEKCTKNPWECY